MRARAVPMSRAMLGAMDRETMARALGRAEKIAMAKTKHNRAVAQAWLKRHSPAAKRPSAPVARRK